MEKEKVLILGAGIGQVALIEKAKKLGYETHVVSPDGNYPGLKLADAVHYENVRDSKAVLAIAQKEGIKGAITDQNDIPIETLGFVCEQMGLTGNSLEVSKLFTHKDHMRKKCKEKGLPTIPFATCNTIDEALSQAEKIGYPVMCKPTNNQSSKGVYKINSSAELKEIFTTILKASFSSNIIIEKYITGTEFVVEGLAINGDFKSLLLLERTYFKKEGVFIPSMVTSPSSLSIQKEKELIDLNNKLCTAFGLQNGLSHAEYILNDEDGQFYLVEVAARGGGAYTSSHLTPAACGFDTAEFLIEMAVGKKLNIKEYNYQNKAVRYICFYLREGTISHIEGIDEILKLEGVIDFFHDSFKIGDQYEGLKDKSDRLGPILIEGENREALEQLTNKIKKTVKVSTTIHPEAVVWQ